MQGPQGKCCDQLIHDKIAAITLTLTQNPCVYFIFNDKFRQGLLDIFGALVPCKDKKEKWHNL